jgi:hypothetical protein
VNDATRRAIRGLVQSGIGATIIGLLAVFEIIHWNEQQTAAVMALLTLVITFAQNMLEDSGAIPSLGKSPASAGAEPDARLEPHG